MRQSKQSDEHTIAFNMFWSIWVLSDRATTELAGCQAAHKEPRVIQSPIAAVDPKLKPGKQFDEIPVGASSLFGLTMTPWLTKNEDSWLIARTHLDCNTSPIYIYICLLFIDQESTLSYHIPLAITLASSVHRFGAPPSLRAGTRHGALLAVGSPCATPAKVPPERPESWSSSSSRELEHRKVKGSEGY